MYPDLSTVLSYRQQGYRRVPVCMELLSDFTTPISLMRILKGVSDHVFLLESVEGGEKWGRYTFLGYDPVLTVTCLDGKMKVGEREIFTDCPAAVIEGILNEYRSPRVFGLPPFAGGLVGYFSYDYLKYVEPSLKLDAPDDEGFFDVDLMLFDKVIAFDNLRQKLLLIVNIVPDEGAYQEAEKTLFDMATLVKEGKPAFIERGKLISEMKSLFSKEAYTAMVERAKEHIREGDLFQIVLSNRFEAAFSGSLFGAYRMLRTLNPSPYLFYLSGSDSEVVGASPETLVKLEGNTLHTFPLAGTRPRGRTSEEDEALERELLSDPKELAEHNMLVDLGRNDLGKLSSFGTVEVERYHEVLRFSHVMHIGSAVKGELAAGKTAMDVIGAVLPAGTLSGAPKIKACQLINDLEGNKRGVYGGAIGYLDFSGNLDVAIAIRLAYRKNGKVFVRSGAGIVADSVPEREYKECLNKAAAVFRALKEGETV
ncbi:MAG: chorismate-binding protein [Clostridia bacterium]|nr:chorismate-binding protein [Clostridia bacterium]